MGLRGLMGRREGGKEGSAGRELSVMTARLMKLSLLVLPRTPCILPRLGQQVEVAV